MKKISLIISSLAIFCFCLSGCQIRKSESSAAEKNCVLLGQTPDHSLRKVFLGGHQLSLEVVQSPASIQQGLSGRSSLAADGMLFIMPSRDTHAFWMKGMLFDLDFLWIKDCQVVAITPNVPRPELNTPSAQLPTYVPNQPVDMVLEVPVGSTSKIFSNPIGQYISL